MVLREMERGCMLFRVCEICMISLYFNSFFLLYFICTKNAFRHTHDSLCPFNLAQGSRNRTWDLMVISPQEISSPVTICLKSSNKLEFGSVCTTIYFAFYSYTPEITHRPSKATPPKLSQCQQHSSQNQYTSTP